MTGVGQIRLGGRPPFPFRLEIPDDWTVLDTAPETWRREAEALIDRQLGNRRLTARQRRGAIDIIADVVAVCQQVGVFLTAVKLARDADDQLFWGSLSLSWYDSAPVEPDLPFLEIVAGRKGLRRRFESELGIGVLVREETVHLARLPWMEPDGRTYGTQVFVPLHDTTWTALFTGTTAQAKHADLMEKVVARAAGSLRADIPRPEKDDHRGHAGEQGDRDSDSRRRADKVRARLRAATRDADDLRKRDQGGIRPRTRAELPGLAEEAYPETNHGKEQDRQVR